MNLKTQIMKKVIFIALAVATIIFISCKENSKKNIKNEVSEVSNDVEEGLNKLGDNIEKTYNETKNNIKATFDDIKIPELDDEKAEAHLKSYAAYVNTQMNKGVENIKNDEFVKETKEFGEKSQKFMENLGEDAKKSFQETVAKIDAKVEEIEKDLEK